MFPELFRIPGLGIPIATYGVLLALAFIAALWLTARLAERDGLPKNRIYDLGLYILASSLIGSKALMIIVEWRDFASDWRRVLSFDLWRSAGVYYGGFLIALLVSVILMRRWRLPWRKTSDAFAPGVALGHAIGRLGCFSAGCCWGRPTTSWIGVHFTEAAKTVTGVWVKVGDLPQGMPRTGSSDDDVYLVPTQLIEAAANLLIFGFLLWLRKRRSFDGQVIYAYLMIYSVARFTIEFWRADERGQVLGISTSQFIAVLLFTLGLVLTVYEVRRKAARSAASSDIAAHVS